MIFRKKTALEKMGRISRDTLQRLQAEALEQQETNEREIRQRLGETRPLGQAALDGSNVRVVVDKANVSYASDSMEPTLDTHPISEVITTRNKVEPATTSDEMSGPFAHNN